MGPTGKLFFARGKEKIDNSALIYVIQFFLLYFRKFNIQQTWQRFYLSFCIHVRISESVQRHSMHNPHKYARTYIHAYMHAYTHTHKHKHTYIHTYAHTHARTHTHTHTHTCIIGVRKAVWRSTQNCLWWHQSESQKGPKWKADDVSRILRAVVISNQHASLWSPCFCRRFFEQIRISKGLYKRKLNQTFRVHPLLRYDTWNRACLLNAHNNMMFYK
jgi:hypothetical protein